jgi:guanine nucleotide-binding protein G(i) subunit alpha
MGCGQSTEDKSGKERNEHIENQLKKDKMMQRNEIKMLLLGKITDAHCYAGIRAHS